MTPQTVSARGNKNQSGGANAPASSNPPLPKTAPPTFASDRGDKAADETAPRSKASGARPADQNAAAEGQRKAANFSLTAPSAKEVCVAGEFTGWEKQPIKLTRDNAGVWQAKVPLPQGRHQYRFIVDGEWQDDPICQDHVTNSFGSNNAVIQIG